MSLRLGGLLGRAPTPRFIWLSLLSIWLVHALVWWAAMVARDIPFALLLTRYDAGWYAGIAMRGYSGSGWAFYPLWPALVAGVARVVPIAIPLLQVLLAALLFALTVRVVFTNGKLAAPLVPETRSGWLLFLLAPAGYVFHTGHTESLFVLLGMTAFARAANGAWLSAAVLAGLSALTKNQGTFVAVAVGLVAFRLAPRNERYQRFFISGAISAALFALFPLYQFLITGDPFISQRSQGDWTSAHGIGDMVETLLLGNSKNPWEYLTRARHPWFIGYLVACVVYLRRTRDAALSVYFFGSVLAMLLQGTVSNLFRYTVILAPLMFFVGDGIGRHRPRAMLVLLAASLYFHAELTWNYAIRRWAY